MTGTLFPKHFSCGPDILIFSLIKIFSLIRKTKQILLLKIVYLIIKCKNVKLQGTINGTSDAVFCQLAILCLQKKMITLVLNRAGHLICLYIYF